MITWDRYEVIAIIQKHIDAAVKDLKSQLSRQRNGDWVDRFGACVCCDGEIPHGHAGTCHIYKQEQEIRSLKSQNKAYAQQLSDLTASRIVQSLEQEVAELEAKNEALAKKPLT